MDAAVGVGVFGGDVVLAELLLDDAAALSLLGAGEARPVDDEALAADETADVRACVRERAQYGLHRGLLRDGKSYAPARAASYR
jgi:hypothetical protein